MSKPACPMCEMTDVMEHPGKWECLTCGHEWERAAEADAPAGPRIVKDAHGTVLNDGDSVILIKDLPLRGSSGVLKGGSKSKPIRLVEGDHEISCKIDGVAVGLKACFVRKA
jgi:protein PhnA